MKKILVTLAFVVAFANSETQAQLVLKEDVTHHIKVEKIEQKVNVVLKVEYLYDKDDYPSNMMNKFEEAGLQKKIAEERKSGTVVPEIAEGFFKGVDNSGNVLELWYFKDPEKDQDGKVTKQQFHIVIELSMTIDTTKKIVHETIVIGPMTLVVNLQNMWIEKASWHDTKLPDDRARYTTSIYVKGTIDPKDHPTVLKILAGKESKSWHVSHPYQNTSWNSIGFQKLPKTVAFCYNIQGGFATRLMTEFINEQNGRQDLHGALSGYNEIGETTEGLLVNQPISFYFWRVDRKAKN